MSAQAPSTAIDNVRLVRLDIHRDLAGRMGANEAIFRLILDDEEFYQVPMVLYAGRVDRGAREQPKS